MNTNAPLTNAPVLVTGASGYIASHVVAELLEAGHTVRATVRSKAKTGAYGHLMAAAARGKGALELFDANLLSPGSFDEAARGCSTVFHMASPFVIAGISDPERELIGPALEGTRNVLGAAARSETVTRVVLTSSVAAIYGDAADLATLGKPAFTEEEWNTSSSVSHQPYSYSKTVAEKEAWRLTAEQSRFDLVTINPGFVMGPSLSKRSDSTSIDFMISLAGGKLRHGVPDLCFGFVDVRDVARAHLAAAARPQAKGRYILCAGSLTMLEMARRLRSALPGKYPLPKREVPKSLIWMFGPALGFSRKFVSKNIGFRLAFDNTRSRTDLGIEYTSPTQTFVDHVAQLEADGLLPRR